jgi:hypothetical protein
MLAHVALQLQAAELVKRRPGQDVVDIGGREPKVPISALSRRPASALDHRVRPSGAGAAGARPAAAAS